MVIKESLFIKKHAILDHPVIGYFVLAIFSNIFAVCMSSIVDVLILARAPKRGEIVELWKNKWKEAV